MPKYYIFPEDEFEEITAKNYKQAVNVLRDELTQDYFAGYPVKNVKVFVVNEKDLKIVKL